MFFTADQHLGDERFDILHRPFKTTDEYVQMSIKLWNEKVTSPASIVYIIGDFVYGPNAKDFLPIADKLNGIKILIRGNHDTLTDEEYSKYFEKVYSVNGILLSNSQLFLNHYPSHGKKEYWNLCGHIHSAWKVQKNMINVGVDVWHYAPVSLKDINFTKNAICNFYDEDVWVGNHPANVANNVRGKTGSYSDKLE